MNMNRTTASILIMILSTITGFFVFELLIESDCGAVVGSVISGCACIIDSLQHQNEKK